MVGGVCVLVFWVSFGNLLAFSLFVVLQFVMVCVWCFGLLIFAGLGIAMLWVGSGV